MKNKLTPVQQRRIKQLEGKIERQQMWIDETMRRAGALIEEYQAEIEDIKNRRSRKLRVIR